MYKELGLESLKSRRRFRGLCHFYKIKTFGLPSYLPNLISSGVYSHNTRHSEDVITYHFRTDTFKYLFFLWTIESVESAPHFFLHCHYFTGIWKTLFHELQSVDKNILNQPDNEIAELLLYGSSKIKLQQGCRILRSSIRQDKIWMIQWFNCKVKCITLLYFCLFLQSLICILI